MFNGKIHYKLAIFDSYFKLPEGKSVHFLFMASAGDWAVASEA